MTEQERFAKESKIINTDKVLIKKDEEGFTPIELRTLYASLRTKYKSLGVKLEAAIHGAKKPIINSIINETHTEVGSNENSRLIRKAVDKLFPDQRTDQPFKILYKNITPLEKGKTYIHLFSHQTANDVTNASEVVGRNIKILVATEPLSEETLKALENVGYFGVDRTDPTRKSQNNSMNEMVKYSVNGGEVGVFGTAVWNYDPKKLTLPLHYGPIRLSIIADAEIVIHAMQKNEDGNFVINDAPTTFKPWEYNDIDIANLVLTEKLGALVGDIVFDEENETVIGVDENNKKILAQKPTCSRENFDPVRALEEIIAPTSNVDWNLVSEKEFVATPKYHLGRKFVKDEKSGKYSVTLIKKYNGEPLPSNYSKEEMIKHHEYLAKLSKIRSADYDESQKITLKSGKTLTKRIDKNSYFL